MNATLKKDIEHIRSTINLTGGAVKNLHQSPSLQSDLSSTDLERAAINEAHANITLAYRHLEDARMRMGKAIQALEGGVSIYDKDPVPKGGVD